MGIADLGDPSGGAQPGTFNTTTFRGVIDLGDLSAYNSTLGLTASWVSFQLNAFLVFDYEGAGYSYWVQDVALLDTSDREISFEDNLWNVTSVDLASSAVHGNGSVSGTGSNSYYGDTAPCSLAGACISLANPQNVTLEMRAVLESGGIPAVRLAYADGGSLETYDVMEFPFVHSLARFPGFEVEAGLGLPGGCPRCYGDVELVLGGPGYGYQTSLSGTTEVVLSLDWWNGYDFEAVPDAVDYGVATEEGVSGAVVSPTAGSDDAPTATLTNGAGGTLGHLWTPATLTLVEVTVAGGPGAGDLEVESVAIPFERNFAELLLVPGSELLTVTSGANTYPLGSFGLTEGEALTLAAGGYPLVFLPQGLPASTVWEVTTGGRSLNGTGNITFAEPSGSYTYTVAPVSGYRASPTSGEASVAGGSDVVTIDWSPVHTNPFVALWNELGPWGPLVIFLVVVLAVGAAVSVALSHRRPGGGSS